MRSSSWPRLLALAACALATVDMGAVAWGLVAGGASCTSTTAVNADLISGIKIDTGLLLGGDNFTCGEQPGDVYKYVAVVINNNHDIGGAGIFDCFADAVFANLPGTDAGALDFAVWVYVYDYTAYNEANTGNALVNAVNTLNGVYQPDGSMVSVPLSSVPDGGTAKRGYPGALSTICLRPATWVTTCSAVSQPGVEVSASCAKLRLETTVASSCNLAVDLPDARHD